MKTYTINSDAGTFTYQADTQGEALRAHTQAHPGTSVLSIMESYRAEADALEASAD